MAITRKDEALWHRQMKGRMQTVDEKRTRLIGLIKALDKDPALAAGSEAFTVWIGRAQDLLAELFAEEEAIIGLEWMPETEKRMHLIEHDRLLDLFARIGSDPIQREKASALDLCRRLRGEIGNHVARHDLKLRNYAGSDRAPEGALLSP